MPSTIGLELSTWYFGSTLRQIALHVHDSVCKSTLEFSIFVKMLHNIFGHSIDIVILSGVLFCCKPSSTVLLNSLRDKSLMWSSKTVCTQLSRLVKLDQSVKDQTSNSHNMQMDFYSQLAVGIIQLTSQKKKGMKKLFRSSYAAFSSELRPALLQQAVSEGSPHKGLILTGGWYQCTLCRKRPLYYKGLFYVN